MSEGLRNHPSTGSGTTRRNDCYTKCGGFDKLNHRNANLLDSLLKFALQTYYLTAVPHYITEQRKKSIDC